MEAVFREEEAILQSFDRFQGLDMAVKVNYASWWRKWWRDLGVIFGAKFEVSVYVVISQCSDDKVCGLNKTHPFSYSWIFV